MESGIKRMLTLEKQRRKAFYLHYAIALILKRYVLRVM